MKKCGHNPVRLRCKLCWDGATKAERLAIWGGRTEVDGVPLPWLGRDKSSAPRAGSQPTVRHSARRDLTRYHLPCVRLGEMVSESGAGCTRCKVFACALHGECTKTPYDHRRACSGCGDYRPPYRWISTRQLAHDTINALLPKLPADLAGIVGIPRSGMIPASILAATMHLPLYSLDGSEIKPVGHGVRAKTFGLAGGDGPLVVVDDTAYAGHAMRRARAAMRGRAARFAVVYAHPMARGDLDLWGEYLHPPHLLEWNLLNNGTLSGKAEYLPGGVALDFDGVICRDGDPSQPLLLPRAVPIPRVITGRAESHRAATLAWCTRWGVRIDRLDMRPPGVGDDWASIARWKASVYRDAPHALYVESDARQAELIAAESAKPVACPAAERVFQ